MSKVPSFSQKILSRRTVLLRGLGALSLLGIAGLPGCAYVNQYMDQPPGGVGPRPNSPGLGALARKHNQIYGAAVQSDRLEEADFADALQREVSIIVPENELKWYKLRPSQNEFDFSGYHKLADFARANNIAMRGHTLVWYEGNPPWLEAALEERGAAEKILKTHIDRVIKETSPFIHNWDVVNEAVDWHAEREDGLRESVWLKALGPDYIEMAFRFAHKANPNLTLVYNDYGTEQGDGNGRRKRQCILRLLEKCKREKVPVHALGLQSHLHADMPLAGTEFTEFLHEVRSLGLKVYITELDLDISKLSGPADDAIHLAQNYLRSYLDMVQKGGAVKMLLTWGLSDRYSWLRDKYPDLAGMLPLDDNLNRGPMWETLKKDWLKF